jgi:excisionase family DNA binding protein
LSSPPDEHVSVGEAARILGMPRHTVLRWIREKWIPSEVTNTGELRLLREDVIRLIVRPLQEDPDPDEE